MKEPHLDEICDICGDAGFDNALATCSSCCSHEHGYCMPVLLHDIPEDWICKSCLSSGMVLPEAGGKDITMRTMTIYCSEMTTAGGKSQAVAEQKNSDVEKSKLVNILPIFKLYCDYLPTSHGTWKGGFFVTNSTPKNFLGGFKAQLPPSISRRASEFSGEMPLVLSVELLPQSQILADLFQNDCPDLRDIALYFSPDDNIESSKEHAASLFEQMEVQNSLMRSSFNGVELLIFTSKQLHVDSQNVIARLEAKYQFWGVFRPVKDNHTLDKGDAEPPPVMSSVEHAHNDRVSMDDSEAVDMEIDMAGGENVGRVDMVVSRYASKRHYELTSNSGSNLRRTQDSKQFCEQAEVCNYNSNTTKPCRGKKAEFHLGFNVQQIERWIPSSDLIWTL
uniref:AIPP2-like SPOC-like domain-containing protein n=1 Tax=Quercus lobata TaxID=97700 RepID=A0A7N2LBH5_QUELO